MPMLLAIDTSTTHAGIALYDGATVRHQESWQAGRHHTAWLAPAIEAALHRLGQRPEALTALAVALGPGSFTGLRVGLSLAKGIAAARGLPLVGIPTLAATAYPHLGQGRPLCAALHAGRGRHAYALFMAEATQPSPEPSTMALGTAAQLAERLAALPPRDWLIAGEWSAEERALLAARLDGKATVLPPALALRAPAVLAELGWQRLASGQVDDLHHLEPLYLQPPTSG